MDVELRSLYHTFKSKVVSGIPWDIVRKENPDFPAGCYTCHYTADSIYDVIYM